MPGPGQDLTCRLLKWKYLTDKEEAQRKHTAAKWWGWDSKGLTQEPVLIPVCNAACVSRWDWKPHLYLEVRGKARAFNLLLPPQG